MHMYNYNSGMYLNGFVLIGQNVFKSRILIISMFIWEVQIHPLAILLGKPTCTWAQRTSSQHISWCALNYDKPAIGEMKSLKGDMI